MDPLSGVARSTVKKSLGPDPSMGRKVDLLRRLVAMREDQRKKGPVAGIGRPRVPSGRPRVPGGRPVWEGLPKGVPTRLPRKDRMGF